MKFVAFILATLLSLASAQSSIAWYEDNPSATEFEISSAEDLRGLAELVNHTPAVKFSGKTIKLTNNINLGGENWTPIGSHASNNNFLGIFDGQGYTISDLSVTVNSSDTSAAGGLFGYVGSGNAGETAQIKNVNVVASKIEVNASAKIYAGGLVGYYRTPQPILNCNVKADSIIARNSISSNISNFAGGIAGQVRIASIKNSSVNANIVSTGYYAGGLTGYLEDDGGIEFSGNYTSGSVVSGGAGPNVGGLIGYIYTTTGTGKKIPIFANNYSSANILASGGTSPYAGGLIGRIYTAATISNSYSSGDVTAKGSLGSSPYAYCGGLVGLWGATSDQSTISNSYSSGNITILKESGDGDFYGGGLIGSIGGTSNMVIANSYASGKITIEKAQTATGSYYMGGLIGYMAISSGTFAIANSYAGGNVLGVNDGSAAKIYVGGIFGRYLYSEGKQTFTSLYYNSDSTSKFAGTICNSSTNCDSSSTTLPGISGKTEAALKKQATFASWDFTSTWSIKEDYLMPFLKGINHVGNVDIKLPTRIYIYTGSPINPKPEIWSKNNGTLLQENFDYYFVYGENKYVGSGTMTVIGKNAYDGLYRTIPITILRKELTISDAQVQTKIYDGTTNATIIGAILQGVCLSDDVHLINLTGTFASANAGTGISVTPHIALDGITSSNYFLTFPVFTGTIEPKDLAEDATQPIFNQIYKDGAELTPEVVVKDGSLILIKDTDYEVSYKDNTEVGTAKVTVTGINNYTGVITSEFEILASHIPLVETFESAHEWILVNSSQINKWAVGTATSNTGSYSAYISNNNGAANAYSTGNTSTVHLYRDIVFPASESDFLITFYFKGNGESNNDYMTLRYNNAGTTPTAGNLLTNTNSTLLGTYQGIANWTLQTVSLPASVFSGKTMRLVFTWRNNGSAGTQPPAAIDDINIYIHLGSVSAPTLASKTYASIAINAVASPATGQDVEYAKSTTSTPPTGASYWQTGLEFTGLLPNTNYYIFARAKDNGTYPSGPASFTMITTEKAPPATVPFNETFENETSRNSWIRADEGLGNRWVFGSAARYGGSYGAYISNDGSTNSYTEGSTAYAHLYRDITFPASASDFTLTFYFKGMGEAGVSYTDYLEVRDISTATTPSAGFAISSSSSNRLLGSYAMESGWVEKTITLPAATYRNTTRRLVFTWINDWTGGTQPPAAIDNILITAPDLPSSSSAKPSSSSTMPSSSSTTPSSSSSDGITVSLPQIATSNNILQIHNGVNLQSVGNAIIEVYALDGRGVARYALTAGVYNVSLGYLPKGLYIVKATFGSERKVLKVLVD